MGAMKPIEQLFTVTDVAERLRISERSVWQLIARGRLTTVRPAGLRVVRIPERSLAALMSKGSRDVR
jgi:excisionase family DNA binding protein